MRRLLQLVLCAGVWAGGIVPAIAQVSNPDVTGNATSAPVAITEEETGTAYRIWPGDTLSVGVFGRPQLTQDALRVDTNGNIRLPLISQPVRAACSTEVELASEIARLYREYLVDPQVTVGVKDYSSQIVEVVGAVGKPGTFQLQRRIRLRELLSVAGGASPGARNILLAHDPEIPSCSAGTAAAPSGEPNILSISVLDLVQGREQNPYVRPGDFVNVQEAPQIFVVGNVSKPSTLPALENLTVMKAIAMAGGRLPGSKDEVRVVRPIPNSLSSTQLIVDLKDVQRRGVPDTELLPGDIVEVYPSIGHMVMRTMLASLASAAVVYYPLAIIH